MFRVQMLPRNYYAIEFDEIDDEQIEAITALVEEGTPVIICNTLDEIDDLTGGESIEVVE